MTDYAAGRPGAGFPWEAAVGRFLRGMEHDTADPRTEHRHRGRRPGRGPWDAGNDSPDGPAERGYRRGSFEGSPGPFGPGFGPPGPWRGRGRGRGRGSRRRGDVRAAILLLLDEAPRHGYELISEISDRSGGIWRPSPGTVYPTLAALEDEGLITIEQIEGRKTASLTEAGRAHVAEHREQFGTPWQEVAGDVRAENIALRGSIAKVGVAASTVALHGTPEQARQAAEILEQTRQALYGLMAQPAAASEDAAPDEDQASEV